MTAFLPDLDLSCPNQRVSQHLFLSYAQKGFHSACSEHENLPGVQSSCHTQSGQQTVPLIFIQEAPQRKVGQGGEVD